MISVYYLWLFNLLLVRDLTIFLVTMMVPLSSRLSDQQVRINTFPPLAADHEGKKALAVTSFVDATNGLKCRVHFFAPSRVDDALSIIEIGLSACFSNFKICSYKGIRLF